MEEAKRDWFSKHYSGTFPSIKHEVMDKKCQKDQSRSSGP